MATTPDSNSKTAAPAAPENGTVVPFCGRPNSETPLQFIELPQDPLTLVTALHCEIIDAARTSLDKAIRIGEILTGLKQDCGHGKWIAFMKEHLPFSERTANNYMRLFRERDGLKSANFADFPLSTAYSRHLKSARKENTEHVTSETFDEVQANALQPAEAPKVEIDPSFIEDDKCAIVQPAPAVVAPPANMREDSTAGGVVTPEMQAETGSTSPVEPLSFQLADGTKHEGWISGWIPTGKAQKRLKELESFPGSPSPVLMALRQRVYLAGASEINRCVTADSSDDVTAAGKNVLDAIENALGDLRQLLQTHPNYSSKPRP